MKKIFKKAFVLLASVVATMSLSAVVVSAAEGTYELWPSDFGQIPASGSVTELGKGSVGTTGTNNYFGYNFESGAYKLQAYGTRAGSTAVTNNTGLEFIGELQAGGSGNNTNKRTITISPEGNAEVTVYVYTTSLNRSYTIDGQDSTGVAVKDTANFAEKHIVHTLKFNVPAGTYAMYPNGSNDVLLGIVVNESAPSAVEKWPIPADVTGNVTETLVNTVGDKTQLVTGHSLTGSASVSNTTMVDETNNRIRFGADVDSAAAKVPEWGALYFEQAGDFTVVINGVSSGSDSSRTVCLGTVDDSGTITEIGTMSVYGYAGTIDSYKVTGSATNKYAIYAKDKNNFRLTDVFVLTGENAAVTTEDCIAPVVTFSEAVLNGNYVEFSGTFNAFTVDGYTVTDIKLMGAKLDTETWSEFNIINIKDNGDGTYTFFVKCTDPASKARFQVAVSYETANTNLSGGTNYSDVLIYTPAA